MILRRRQVAPPSLRACHERVAARGTVPRDEDVLPVVAHGHRRLVVPGDLPLGRDRLGPRPAVVVRSREVDVPAVHPDRVHRARVTGDLEDRVGLPGGAFAPAYRPGLAPGLPAVLRAFEHDRGVGAVRAERRPVARDGHVHPGVVRVRGHGGLPVVVRGVDDPRAGPPGAGSRSIGSIRPRVPSIFASRSALRRSTVSPVSSSPDPPGPRAAGAGRLRGAGGAAGRRHGEPCRAPRGPRSPRRSPPHVGTVSPSSARHLRRAS